MNEQLSGENQAKIDPVERIRPYQWKKGQSGNPKGRPVSVIKKIKDKFAEDPDTFEEWIEDYLADKNNKKHVVEMIDGKPKQKSEIEARIEHSVNKEEINKALDDII